jgi:protein-S-isoprenylcysteine O-methyltransferase Ste14
MITMLLKSIGLILSLAAVIALLILIPAWQFQTIGDWRILFLAIGYFTFFLGTVWRVIRYGKLVDRQEDLQVKETAGRAASLVTIVGLIGVHWLAIYTFSMQAENVDSILTNRLNALGISLVVAAMFVSQIAIRTLGKFFDRLAIKSDHRLVTDGIYGFVRHPIYTSYILLFIGFCTLLQSLWGFGLLLAVCLVWFGNRIGIEERMLLARFGNEYQVYCQQTKRLFPYLY